jgi:hypothetical protein
VYIDPGAPVKTISSVAPVPHPTPGSDLLRRPSLNGPLKFLLSYPGVFAQPKIAGYLPRCPMFVSTRPPLTRASLAGAIPCKTSTPAQIGGVAQALLSFNGAHQE